jgi:hypothetical protein
MAGMIREGTLAWNDFGYYVPEHCPPELAEYKRNDRDNS